MHIPFCVKKCSYCDFLSFEGEQAPIHEAYAEALVKEIELLSQVYSKKYLVNSIFIGGGTPSILALSTVSGIMHAVRAAFHVEKDAEITIEANPRTLSALKLESYLSAGINRLSIGAQSLDDAVLKSLGRVHLSRDVFDCYGMARAAGFNNINLDLMFGVPGQTFEIWKSTLDEALGLEPEHVSFYSLQVEEGTKLHEMLAAGAVEGVSDELDRKMYHFAAKALQGAGYCHYEISNAAKPGLECKHNVKYWSMANYLGAGLGAHSYIGGARFGNVRSLEKYIEMGSKRSGELTEIGALREWVHENDPADDMSEYMFTGLRMMKGISTEDFENRFGRRLVDVYAKEWPAVERYISGGFLIFEGGMLRLSEKGVDISNRIMSEFMLGSGRRPR